MNNSERIAIATCPNPQCGMTLWSDDDNDWCYHCGEPFPADFVARLPELRARRAVPDRSIESGATPSGESPRSHAGRVMKRYRDAYRVANTVAAVGDAIKAFGIVTAIVFALLAFIAMKSLGVLALLTCLIAAAIIGLVGWLGGVLLSSQGQILLASLDGVVGTSPFLTYEEKAEVMTLS